jgi:CRP-like cAMP-binding protein
VAFISDEVRMATLVARGDVRTLTIDQSQFREILRLQISFQSVQCNV